MYFADNLCIGSLCINNNVGYCKTKRKVGIQKRRKKERAPTLGEWCVQTKKGSKMNDSGGKKKKKIEKMLTPWNALGKKEKQVLLYDVRGNKGTMLGVTSPRGIRLAKGKFERVRVCAFVWCMCMSVSVWECLSRQGAQLKVIGGGCWMLSQR